MEVAAKARAACDTSLVSQESTPGWYGIDGANSDIDAGFSNGALRSVLAWTNCPAETMFFTLSTSETRCSQRLV
jgi:hypothetical protein